MLRPCCLRHVGAYLSHPGCSCCRLGTRSVLPAFLIAILTQMEAKRLALEDQARSIEKTINTKASRHAALEATIRSAELYFQALRLTDKPSDRRRIDGRCKELLAQAENLKKSQEDTARPTVKNLILKVPTSTRKLTTRENIIILEGSKLHGFIFKPWLDSPNSDEFKLASGEIPFTDTTPLPLSQGQLETFDGWKRPQDALASLKVSTTGEPLPAEAVMQIPEEMDLVQDMTSDCSVVASLCAGTSRVERGHPKVRVFSTTSDLLTCYLDHLFHCISL